MTFKRRNRNNSNSGRTQNSQNQSSKRNNNTTNSNGKARFNKVSEFKFQLQDSGNKKAYTFEKIKEAVILKIQTDFQAGRYVVSSLRSKVKSGPPTPTRETSSKANEDERRIEQETLNRKYEAKLVHFFKQEEDFQDNWIKAYGLIYRSYCTREMQIALKELSNFEVDVLDNPLQLLEEIERLMHVPRRAVYPTLALIETLNNLMSL